MKIKNENNILNKFLCKATYPRCHYSGFNDGVVAYACLGMPSTHVSKFCVWVTIAGQSWAQLIPNKKLYAVLWGHSGTGMTMLALKAPLEDISTKATDWKLGGL